MPPSPPNSTDVPDLTTDMLDTTQTDITPTPYDSTSETTATNPSYSAGIPKGPDSKVDLSPPSSSPANSTDVSSISANQNTTTSADNLLTPKSTGDGPDADIGTPETTQSASSSTDIDPPNPSYMTKSQGPDSTSNTPLSIEAPGTTSSSMDTPGYLPESSYSTQDTTGISPELSYSTHDTPGQSSESPYSNHDTPGNSLESSYSTNTSTHVTDIPDKGPVTESTETQITTSTSGATDSSNPLTTRQSYEETPSTNIAPELPQVSTESPDTQTEPKVTSAEVTAMPTSSMDSNKPASIESDTNEQSMSEEPGKISTSSANNPDSTQKVNSTIASHMPDISQEVEHVESNTAQAEQSSIADTAEDNTMAQSETPHELPTVGVREPDQSADTSYRPTLGRMGSTADTPTLGGMMADTPTVSLEDPKTMRTEKKTKGIVELF